MKLEPDAKLKAPTFQQAVSGEIGREAVGVPVTECGWRADVKCSVG